MVKYCKSCAHAEIWDNKAVAYCRRAPPTAAPDSHLAIFPLVRLEDWCSEWKDKHMVDGETPPAIPTTAPTRMAELETPEGSALLEAIKETVEDAYDKLQDKDWRPWRGYVQKLLNAYYDHTQALVRIIKGRML